jgi:hypothetical protein
MTGFHFTSSNELLAEFSRLGLCTQKIKPKTPPLKSVKDGAGCDVVEFLRLGLAD